MPPALVHPALVPPAISDTLAAAARDDFIAAALPAGWRAQALALLSKLRPDVGEVLAAAAEAERAVRNAQRLVHQVRLGRAGVCLGRGSERGWLQQVRLPGQSTMPRGWRRSGAQLCAMYNGLSGCVSC